MPGRIFTPQERKRLDAFPSEIAEADLIRYFTLSHSDLDLVRRQRAIKIALDLPYSSARCVIWASAPMILKSFRPLP